jgi:hypothetical protein
MFCGRGHATAAGFRWRAAALPPPAHASCLAFALAPSCLASSYLLPPPPRLPRSRLPRASCLAASPPAALFPGLLDSPWNAPTQTPLHYAVCHELCRSTASVCSQNPVCSHSQQGGQPTLALFRGRAQVLEVPAHRFNRSPEPA